MRKSLYIATSRSNPQGNASLQQLVAEARSMGWQSHLLPWQDIDPQTVTEGSVVLPLAVWDYSLTPQKYCAWLDALTVTGARIFNAPSLQRWNMDKRYLCELAAKGDLPITPSLALLPDEDWQTLIAQCGWDNPVCKPLIGQSGRGVRRLHDGVLPVLPTQEEYPYGALLQPFVPAVGEVCLIYIAGEFSHAVQRCFAPGEWRGNSAYGAYLEPIVALPQWQEIAKKILATLPVTHSPLYARIDGLRDPSNRLTINEVELIEPSLCTTWQPLCYSRLLKSLENIV